MKYAIEQLFAMCQLQGTGFQLGRCNRLPAETFRILSGAVKDGFSVRLRLFLRAPSDRLCLFLCLSFYLFSFVPCFSENRTLQHLNIFCFSFHKYTILSVF